MQVQSLTLLSGLKIRIAVSCGIGCRCGSDPALMWLWPKLVGTALSRPPSLEISIYHECGPKKKIPKDVHNSRLGQWVLRKYEEERNKVGGDKCPEEEKMRSREDVKCV